MKILVSFCPNIPNALADFVEAVFRILSFYLVLTASADKRVSAASTWYILPQEPTIQKENST